MRGLLALMLVMVPAELAARECRAPAKGKPIYREERGPLRPPAEGQPSPVPVVSFEIFANGAWRWLESGEAGSGEAIGQAGCADAEEVRDLMDLIARARFKVDGTVPTCEAVPTVRVVIEAPRRGKKVVTERSCGPPLDRDTELLVTCARGLGGRGMRCAKGKMGRR